MTVAQVAVAWVLGQGRRHRAARRRAPPRPPAEALGALAADLDDADLKAIETAIPRDAAAGERYAPAQMAVLDSERTTQP